jgi:hypothetical protein
MKISGEREYCVDLKMMLDQEEAKALMALVQNAQTDPEPAISAALRENIFNTLYNLGVRM